MTGFRHFSIHFLTIIGFSLTTLFAKDFGGIERPNRGVNFKKTFAAEDPLVERAVGFLDKGKFKISVGNWGLLTGTGYSPEGLWGPYQYLPVISLVFGVPGKDREGNPYPWAIGRKTVYDFEEQDYVDRGSDTTYWGPTVSEAWMDRTFNLDHTDWESVKEHSINLHGDATAGQFYGDNWTFPDDQFPVMATSDIIESWPLRVDSLGDEIRTWPGPWATDTTGKELTGTFVSDQDIYFEFDDRMATRDIDPNQGYPMGIHSLVSAYSYGSSVAEDIIFFNMRLVNESEYQYERAFGGFYFDADSYHRTAAGSYSGRTNDDDMMGFNTEWDYAYIYDFDDDSEGATNLAWVGLKLLDTPLATEPVDIDNDGIPDIQIGEELGLTDWHYFDWYVRPGARDESPSGPFTGDFETPVAEDKEAIQYKLMAGDTSSTDSNIPDHAYNLFHYFFPDPAGNLNPHFDSFARLKAENPDGLDCVFIMSSGPFTFSPGDTIPFSFAVIAGQDSTDLVANAEIAQLMYDNFYRGPTPPQAPNVSVLEGFQKVNLFWDDVSINSRDALTEIKDFEGFRIYKSTDNGLSWGEERIDDSTRTSYFVPMAEYDLDNKIKGHDPTAPHRFLGNNSGLVFQYEDTDVQNGVEYLYAVCAFDWGFIPGDPVRDSTDGKFQYQLASLENFLSSSDLQPHIVRAIPHAPPSNVRQDSVIITEIDTTKGNGKFDITVVDTKQLTNDEYFILFHGDPDLGNTNFDLINNSKGDTLLKNSTQFIVIDPGAQFETIPPRIDGLEWVIRSATRTEVNREEIEWVNSQCDYQVTTNFFTVSNRPVVDYYVVFRGGDASPVYARRPVLDTTDVVFTVPFEVWNKKTIDGNNQFQPRKAKLMAFPDNSPFGEWNSGDRFLLHEDQLIDRPLDEIERTIYLTFTWSDTPYVDPERPNVILPANIPWAVGDSLVIPVFNPFQEGDGYIVETSGIYQIEEPQQEDISKVRVVPNPYIVSAAWEFDEFSRKIQFQNLPSRCTIYIFNIAGELVQTLYHDDLFDGSEDWNLWTSNRQEVAPGLYIWVVETPDGKKDKGKFSIIR